MTDTSGNLYILNDPLNKEPNRMINYHSSSTIISQNCSLLEKEEFRNPNYIKIKQIIEVPKNDIRPVAYQKRVVIGEEKHPLT